MESLLQPILDDLASTSPAGRTSLLCVLALAGLYLLTKGGDVLTDGAAALARNLGVHPAVIGLTVVSMATSAPELFTSLAAISGEAKGLILGNVVGSNLANVGLILGLATFLGPIRMKDSLPPWQTSLLFLLTVLFTALCLWPGKGEFSRENGITFIVILLCYLVFVTRNALSDRKAGRGAAAADEEEETTSTGKACLLALGATAVLWVGSDALVLGAKGLAHDAGVPQELVGLTLVAIGTSLPELAASWALAKRGESAMLIGNVVGSNLFNLTFVAGVAASLSPLKVDASLGEIEFPFMLLVTALLWWLHRRERMGRRHGVLLLVLYAAAIGAASVWHS